MEQAINKKIAILEAKIDQLQRTNDELKKYFKWNFIISVVFIVLPIIAAVIILPIAMRTIMSAYSGLL